MRSGRVRFAGAWSCRRSNPRRRRRRSRRTTIPPPPSWTCQSRSMTCRRRSPNSRSRLTISPPRWPLCSSTPSRRSKTMRSASMRRRPSWRASPNPNRTNETRSLAQLLADEPAAETMPEIVDETAFEIDTEFAAVETDTYVPIDDTPAYEETWAQPESDSDARADSSLDDLVDEILRRGAEPDLPDGSDTTDDLFADLPSVPEVIDDSSEPAAALYVFEDAPTEPPVDEPPADEPPVDEPVPDEPPAEEPPAYDPPVQDPPAEEPPSEETPPMWVRAAIEKMARTRQERPAAPAPRPADMRGPVFEISEEPEHELAAETTTLSDIAKELGLSIPVPDAKAERWVKKQEESAAEEIEAGWEEEERRPSRSRPRRRPMCLRRRRSNLPRRCSSRTRRRRSKQRKSSRRCRRSWNPSRPRPFGRSLPHRSRSKPRRQRRLRAARWPSAPLESASRADAFSKSPRRSSSWWAVSRQPRTAAGATTRASALRGRSSSSPRRPVRRSRSTAPSEGRRRLRWSSRPAATRSR